MDFNGIIQLSKKHTLKGQQNTHVGTYQKQTKKNLNLTHLIPPLVMACSCCLLGLQSSSACVQERLGKAPGESSAAE